MNAESGNAQIQDDRHTVFIQNIRRHIRANQIHFEQSILNSLSEISTPSGYNKI